MIDSIYKSPFFAGAMYVFGVIAAVFYICFKNRKGQLVTIGNIFIYVTLVSYIVMTPFQYTAKAWATVHRNNYEYYFPYLNKSVSINFIGLIIFLLAEIFFEQKLSSNRQNRYIGHKIVSAVESLDLYRINTLIFSVCAAGWIYISFTYGGGLPIFSKNRLFFFNEGGFTSALFQLFDYIINLYGLYFGMTFIENKRGGLFALIAVFLSFASGSRSRLFMVILAPLLILYVYKRHKRVTFNVLPKLVVPLVLMLALGGFIYFFRIGESAEGSQLLDTLFYGNTFSDIRDGGLVFYGYETRKGNELLLGKSYLASLMAFIPSSFSSFRQKWSFGRYTAQGIWGLANHLGFRGGYALEQYCNFRMPGVIFLTVLSAYFFATMETISTEKIYDRILKGKPLFVNAVFFIRAINMVSMFFLQAGNSRELYTYLILIVGIVALYSAFPIGTKARRYRLVWRK